MYPDIEQMSVFDEKRVGKGRVDTGFGIRTAIGILGLCSELPSFWIPLGDLPYHRVEDLCDAG